MPATWGQGLPRGAQTYTQYLQGLQQAIQSGNEGEAYRTAYGEGFGPMEEEAYQTAYGGLTTPGGVSAEEIHNIFNPVYERQYGQGKERILGAMSEAGYGPGSSGLGGGTPIGPYAALLAQLQGQLIEPEMRAQAGNLQNIASARAGIAGQRYQTGAQGRQAVAQSRYGRLTAPQQQGGGATVQQGRGSMGGYSSVPTGGQQYTNAWWAGEPAGGWDPRGAAWNELQPRWGGGTYPELPGRTPQYETWNT